MFSGCSWLGFHYPRSVLRRDDSILREQREGNGVGGGGGGGGGGETWARDGAGEPFGILSSALDPPKCAWHSKELRLSVSATIALFSREPKGPSAPRTPGCVRRLTPRAPPRRDFRRCPAIAPRSVRGESSAIKIRPLCPPATLLRELDSLSPGNDIFRGRTGRKGTRVAGVCCPGDGDGDRDFGRSAPPWQDAITGSSNYLIAAITVHGPDEKILPGRIQVPRLSVMRAILGGVPVSDCSR